MRSVLYRLAALLCLALCVSGCGYGQVISSWFDHTSAAGGPAGDKLSGHVYLLRGLAGDIYSLGMDQLAEKIRRGGVTATVHGMSEHASLTDAIIRKYKSNEETGPIMLIGHSSGGDLIMTMAKKMKDADVPVALAVSFDPTRIVGDVPSNVETFINLYQRYNPIGGGEVSAGPGFRGRLINVDLHEHTEIVHITLDKTAAVQDVVTAKIVAIAAYAARQPKSPPAAPADGADVLPLELKYAVPRDEPIELWDSAIKVKAQPGETLQSIAAAYHAPLWAVAQINGIEPGTALERGGSLLVPYSTYTDAPPPAPAIATRDAVQPLARVAARPAPQDLTPTGSIPAPAPSPPVQNASSFNDRWRLEAKE